MARGSEQYCHSTIHDFSHCANCQGLDIVENEGVVLKVSIVHVNSALCCIDQYVELKQNYSWKRDRVPNGLHGKVAAAVFVPRFEIFQNLISTSQLVKGLLGQLKFLVIKLAFKCKLNMLILIAISLLEGREYITFFIYKSQHSGFDYLSALRFACFTLPLKGTYKSKHLLSNSKGISTFQARTHSSKRSNQVL